MQRKLLRINNVDFDITVQLLIIYSVFVKYLKKMGIQRSSASAVYRFQDGILFIYEGVVYNILIEFA
jgi:hypothetical protein